MKGEYFKSTLIKDRKERLQWYIESYKKSYPDSTEDEAVIRAKKIIRSSNKENKDARALSKIMGAELEKLGYVFIEQTIYYNLYERWTQEHGRVEVIVGWMFDVLEINVRHEQLKWDMYPKTANRLRTYMKAYNTMLSSLFQKKRIVYEIMSPCIVEKYNRNGFMKLKILK